MPIPPKLQGMVDDTMASINGAVDAVPRNNAVLRDGIDAELHDVGARVNALGAKNARSLAFTRALMRWGFGASAVAAPLAAGAVFGGLGATTAFKGADNPDERRRSRIRFGMGVGAGAGALLGSAALTSALRKGVGMRGVGKTLAAIGGGALGGGLLGAGASAATAIPLSARQQRKEQRFSGE